MQEDVAETVTDMLFGAMDELALGDPWHLATDIGPVIDVQARTASPPCRDARRDGRLLKQLPAPQGGTFIALP